MQYSIKTIREKKDYVSPNLRVTELKFEGLLCQSPGGGGSEGTGDEPLFAPLMEDPMYTL